MLLGGLLVQAKRSQSNEKDELKNIRIISKRMNT